MKRKYLVKWNGKFLNSRETKCGYPTQFTDSPQQAYWFKIDELEILLDNLSTEVIVKLITQ